MTGSYHYAEAEDKAGNTLITSYKKEEQAKKYRPGALYSEGLLYLDLETGDLLPEGELLVRTVLTRKTAQEEMTGDFVVYAKVNDQWQRTQFRYSTYAAANTAVKGALINIYDACAVIEEN